MDRTPRWAGSGTFRVARSRMLEKLSRFRHAEPGQFILDWVRAAVSAEATRIRFRSLPDGNGFELRFDGRPFSRPELEDPYGPFFEAADAGARRRHFLASGLLGALRSGPEGVAIASGEQGERHELLARSIEEETLLPASHPGTGTRVRVWGLEGFGEARLREALGDRCGASPAPVSVDGRALPFDEADDAPELVSLRIVHDGVRGRVWPAASPGKMSAVRLSVCGVLAERAEVDTGGPEVRARLSDDRLTLDASHGRVVRDERFRLIATLLREAAQRLLLQVLAGHRRSLREAARLLLGEARLREDWRAGFGPAEERLGSALEALPGLGRALRQLAGHATPWPASRPARAAIAEAALRTRWLRAACLRGLAGWRKRPGPPSDVLRPLWAAPVFLDWHGRPLTAAELRLEAERSGRLRVSKVPAPPGAPEGLVVWLAAWPDREDLGRLLPETGLESASL